MATVFRARDRELRREVAVKVLHPHLGRRREAIARFHREARTAAGLDHRHILRVLDVGGGEPPAGGGAIDPPYIVLELVSGPSLAELLSTRPRGLLAENVAAIGAIVAEALACAHAAGIVHRDVKPANLLAAEGGRLVLGDFGVARITDEDSVETRSGAVLGTPAFMSPEQASGEPLDGRSDLYSLGATLYQLATGVLPVGGTPGRAIAAILAGDIVPVERRRPAAGGELGRAIARLMCREPAGRPASARDAAALLTAIAGEVGEPHALVATWLAGLDTAELALRPRVVARSLARGRAALDRGDRTAAATHLERALALEPGSAEAAALMARLVARRRGRVVLAAAAAIVVGAAVVVPRLAGRSGAPPPADRAAAVADAGLAAAGAPPSPADAAGPPPARLATAVVDLVRPSRRGRRLAGEPAPGPPPAPPASGGEVGPASAGPADAGPRPVPTAALTLDLRPWCDVTIDGRPHGRASALTPIDLAPGEHEIVCSQGPGLGSWSGSVVLGPGEARTLRGSVLRQIQVAFDLPAGESVRVGRVGRFAGGQVATLPPTRYSVQRLRGDEAIGDAVYVTFRAPCTLRFSPALECAPR